MLKGTKYYSDRQEKMVAHYLGWQQVTGSGARPTFVGDVIGDTWLGECKTHVSLTDKITFRFDVWDKLEKEAISRFQDPVLIVDDGSQKPENTFVLIKLQDIPADKEVTDVSDSASFSIKNCNELKSRDKISTDFIRNGNYFVVFWLPTFRSLLK